MSEHRVSVTANHTPLVAQLTAAERAALAADLLAANVRELIQADLASANPPELRAPPSAAPDSDGYAPVMRPEQAAAYCAIGVNRLRDLLKVGVIHGRRSGRRWLVRREALDEWMRTEEEAEQRRRDVRAANSGGGRGRSDILRSSLG